MPDDKPVDLSKLKTVSVAELAQRPNQEWLCINAPVLFEQWWEKYRIEHRLTKRSKDVARAAWYACADSLGVYDDNQHST